jgi:SNF2 family DNA or RNA helicase
MNFEQDLTKIFNLDAIQDYIDTYGEEFKDEVLHLLNKNGGEIPLRRQINDYYTFSVIDQSTETIIIKASKKPYSASCTCKYFQVNDACAHILTVLTSIKQQSQKTKISAAIASNSPVALTSNAETNSIFETNSDPSKKYIIAEADNMSYQKLYRLFPFLSGYYTAAKTQTKKLDQGIQVLCKNQYDRFNVDFVVNQDNDVELTCSCGQTYEGRLCDHAKFGISYIANQFNQGQFTIFLNKDKEKSRILAEYGLTLQDEEAKSFLFGETYDGKLELKKAPSQYKNFSAIDKLRKAIIVEAGEEVVIRKRSRFLDNVDPNDIGLCLIYNDDVDTNQPLYFEPFRIEEGKKGVKKFTKLPLALETSLSTLSNLDDETFEVLMEFGFERFKHKIRSEIGILNYATFTSKFISQTRRSYLQYFFATLDKHWDIIAKWPQLVWLGANRIFHHSNTTTIQLASEVLRPKIEVTENAKFIEITCQFKHTSGSFSHQEIEIILSRLVKVGSIIYRHDRPEMATLLSLMVDGKIFFPIAYRKTVVQELLMPLVGKYDIILPTGLQIDIEKFDMEAITILKEVKDQYLSITPAFKYGESTFTKDSSSSVHTVDGHQKYVQRDAREEEEFYQFVQSLHNDFKQQKQSASFMLSMDDVMKNNWFITFTAQILDKGIKIEGLDQLKRFKYNTATPSWNMSVSSGIDWFDVHVSATWGDQTLGFKEIKKAISSGQNYAILPDGSLGMIPAEWIQKYSYLLKIAKEDGDGGKLSKKQFGIVDLLYNEIDDEQVRMELDEKKKQLLSLDYFEPHPVPAEIKAQLRPYQETGYQWMQVLDQASWGGCLADDMGLGKTLQAITFLQYVKQQYKAPTSLIICPTTLMFNWQNELDKFAPDLKYHIFYGLGRQTDDLNLMDFDLIITSYGVARNDVENLIQYQWEYIILDESQTIKNPDAGITRALQLYKARNKFILSGTPMQNNTFDLYSQFHFLNPGLLGSREFFRNEFATQIDKNNNKDVSITLKRIIKPFMLRRTKAEVAQDLPEKTESILWCQMTDEQQELYNTYKDFYRGALTQKIANDGIAKAGIYILEGLLRLRQICDDPRLIKENDQVASTGIKIRELVREIKENIGDHKILVFSQFTEMLSLIRNELEEEQIKFAYLDGSTNANKRKKEVTTFQEEEDIKVFLISLKAGGVGLNLTAADYVYIVDPWWNPAVEQQAIDRAHRIGQKKNIFAYKMICKGTVEEKILLLQAKKLDISKDLVGEDNAFFKKLTADDIQYLFS